MFDILNNINTRAKFFAEMASVVDFGMPLVKATYHFEGDGPLAFTAHEHLQDLLYHVQNVQWTALEESAACPLQPPLAIAHVYVCVFAVSWPTTFQT
jgi:hypothetical protein